MSTPEQVSNPELLTSLDMQYRHNRNVKARWLLYDSNFARPYVDIEALTVQTLPLNGDETIVDIGASDGSFTRRFQREFGHIGLLVAVEPFISQFKSAQQHALDLDRLRSNLRKELDPESPDLPRLITESLSDEQEEPLRALGATANSLALADNSADILSAMFMLYHVPEEKRPEAIQEFKRVLKPEGIFVMATSGKNNKIRHRIYEGIVAEKLGIEKPAVMNAGFTSEKAKAELTNHFCHVYSYEQASDMVIDNEFALNAYLGSQLSLQDQYKPIPSYSKLKRALNSCVAQPLRSIIENQGVFVDLIRRSVFICSQRPLQLIDPQNKFTEIT